MGPRRTDYFATLIMMSLISKSSYISLLLALSYEVLS